VEFEIISDLDKTVHKISSFSGNNLLDSINEAGIPNISIFGVCNKQLACHSCAIQVINKYNHLEKPSEEEKDVHSELGELYKKGKTRMSCQIFLKEELNGMIVEIPRAAFFLCNQDNEDLNDKKL
jgi:ferredoxin